MNGRHLTLVSSVALLLFAPTAAHAQDACTEGRVRTSETAGRCCWPGQRWATDVRRCDGPPSCPSGLVADGDSCIAPRAAVAPTVQAPSSSVPSTAAPRTGAGTRITPLMPSGTQAATQAPTVIDAGAPPTPTVEQVGNPSTTLGPAEWPIAPAAGPEGLRNLHWHTANFDEGLLVAGTTTSLIGYIEQVSMLAWTYTGNDGGYRDGRNIYDIYNYDILDERSQVRGSSRETACRDAEVGTLLIPLLGVLASGIAAATCRVPYYRINGGDLIVAGEFAPDVGPTVVASIGATLQIVGLVLLVVGLTERPRSLRVDAPISRGSTTRFSVVPHVASADLGGLGLRLEW